MEKDCFRQKCVQFALLVITALLLVLFFGCYSNASIGDVERFEKTQVIENFRNQIDYYNDQIEKLQVVLPRNIPENERVNIISRNEALVKEYSTKIANLENKIDSFLVLSGKDRINRLDFTGNAKEVSNAYLLVKYADNLDDQDNFYNSSSTFFSSEKLKGIIENLWYRDVIVQVIGPGGFFREFIVKARGSSPAFNLPIIGDYTAIFNSVRETRSITKKVGPNIVYYGSNGEPYDYKATLLAW